MNNHKTRTLVLICFLGITKLTAMAPEKQTDTIEDTADLHAQKTLQVIRPVPLYVVGERVQSTKLPDSSDQPRIKARRIFSVRHQPHALEAIETDAPQEAAFLHTETNESQDAVIDDTPGTDSIRTLATRRALALIAAFSAPVVFPQDNADQQDCAAAAPNKPFFDLDKVVNWPACESSQHERPRGPVAYCAREKSHIACDIKPVVLDFVCPLQRYEDGCAKIFTSMRFVRNHMREQHGKFLAENGFKCPYCDRTPKNLDAFINHTYNGHLEKPYQCPICTKTYSPRTSCVLHILATHKRTASYRCACNDLYAAHIDWKQHVRRCPTLADRRARAHEFICPCGTSCTKSEIESHKLSCSWTTGGVFVCPCEKTFSYKKQAEWLEHQTTCEAAKKFRGLS